jgi:hypothetical protein
VEHVHNLSQNFTGETFSVGGELDQSLGNSCVNVLGEDGLNLLQVIFSLGNLGE